MRCEVWSTSVWGTFSASLHMVHEKLEQVLEDTPTEEEEEVGEGKVGLVCLCVSSSPLHSRLCV